MGVLVPVLPLLFSVVEVAALPPVGTFVKLSVSLCARECPPTVSLSLRRGAVLSTLLDCPCLSAGKDDTSPRLRLTLEVSISGVALAGELSLAGLGVAPEARSMILGGGGASSPAGVVGALLGMPSAVIDALARRLFPGDLNPDAVDLFAFLIRRSVSSASALHPSSLHE